MGNKDINQMRWIEGTLWLSPVGEIRFKPYYKYPEVVGDTQVLGAAGTSKYDELIGHVTKTKTQELQLSNGWHLYQRLMKEFWKLV